MGISEEKLDLARWAEDRPPPPRVERAPCRLGPGCVIDPPVVLSPMAAVTNAPFRTVCRELGAGLVVTEMIYSVGLARGEERSMAMLDLRPHEHPVSVQIYGKYPDMMAEAARVVEAAGADAVDINMGCPMRKVTSSGHGAALLQQPKLVFEIVQAMSQAVNIPVTAKIRAGWEDASAVEVARAIEDGGGQAITIHGRTRCDFYDGHADLEAIAAVKEAVGIAVIGNGDICDAMTARRMFHQTGCDAVMVARGCLGNPWVFAEIAADLRGEPVPAPPDAAERARVLRRHAALYLETFGEHRTSREIRKHLLWYFRHTPAETVLRRRLSGLESRADVLAAIAAACETCQDDAPPPRGLDPKR